MASPQRQSFLVELEGRSYSPITIVAVPEAGQAPRDDGDYVYNLFAYDTRNGEYKTTLGGPTRSCVPVLKALTRNSSFCRNLTAQTLQLVYGKAEPLSLAHQGFINDNNALVEEINSLKSKVWSIHNWPLYYVTMDTSQDLAKYTLGSLVNSPNNPAGLDLIPLRLPEGDDSGVKLGGGDDNNQYIELNKGVYHLSAVWHFELSQESEISGGIALYVRQNGKLVYKERLCDFCGTYKNRHTISSSDIINVPNPVVLFVTVIHNDKAKLAKYSNPGRISRISIQQIGSN